MPPEGGQYPHNGGDYRTYTNNVFINKTVLVPVYQQQYDTTALRVLREALPGYKVIGINCNSIIPSLGALHCITKEIGSTDPLLITHQPLGNTSNTTTPYQVDAWIKHKTGIQTATLYYTTDTTQAYQSVTMTLTNGANDTWTGYIPAQPAGSEVFYYIHAQSVSGKQQVRPLPAPDGYWNFDVLGFTTVIEEEIVQPVMQPAYPNPSHGITCIPVRSTSTKGRLYLADILGREITEIYSGNFSKGEKNYFINTINLDAGTYLLVLSTADGNSVQKLMVR